jgi:ABC-type transport system substrate-binding protein
LKNVSFWERYALRQLSRRRFLASVHAAGIGTVAFALAGCSLAPDDSAEEGAPAGLLDRPTDSTSLAIPGGTMKSFVVSDAPSFDPLSTSSFITHTQIASYTYPRLMKFKAATYPGFATGETEGDLIENAEISGDGLVVTLHLRQGQRWEQRTPTNGRLIDANDVLFSWRKFASASPSRGDLAYHAETAPGAPVDSVAAPTGNTVVFRLKQPDASFLGQLASDRLLYVMPRESDGGFDASSDVRGYGPWLMTENRPGLVRVWSRNPDYYFKGRPFPDKLEQVIVSDYMNRLSQFKAGLIWTSVVSQDDVLPTKREFPALVLRQAESFGQLSGSLAFGYDGDSPWKDERLRRAVSLLIDRETMINLKTDREGLAAAGVPVDLRYHTAIAACWEGWWVDPADLGRFGPDGRFYTYDPAEAAKLLTAAGFKDGIDTLLHYNGGNEYGPSYTRTAELLSGMLHEGGIRARLDPRPFQNDWLPNFHQAYTGAANFNRQTAGFPGLIYRNGASQSSFAAQAYSRLHSNGTRFIGMTPDGKNARGGHPDVNRMVEEIRREADTAKQKTQALELARFMARTAFDIPMQPYSVLGLTLTWPAIGNFGVHRSWPGGSSVTEVNVHHWVDTSKQPLSPS